MRDNRKEDNEQNDESALSQRIDKWLWCARFFKTRGLAAKFVSSRSLRLNRHGSKLRVSKPGFLVRPGDRLTYGRSGHVISIKIMACAERRGPASEASRLYENITTTEAND
ncbi:MAG: S4 domain-containing protein [Pseudomonadota bacterium]